MIGPAVPVVLLLMLGVYLEDAPPVSPVIWLAALATVTAAAVFLLRRARLSSLLFGFALVIGGVALGQWGQYYFPDDHISAFATEQPRLAQPELAIDAPPRILSNPFQQGRPLPPKQVVTARVLKVNTWAGWMPSQGAILLQISQPHPRLAAGQTVRVLGMLQRPSPAMNPGQFDWDHYYREQRVLASISVGHVDNIDILTDEGSTWLCRAREGARHLLAAGFPAERSLDHALLRAMLLGDHDPQLRDVQEQFQRTGASYHLSVSGMHVAVLAGLAYWLCRALCLGPRRSVCLVTTFVLAYGMLALPAVPVVRSMLLCLAAAIAMLGARRVHRVQLLAICAAAMLIVHPQDLFSAGFQLGFGTVLGLVLLTRPMMEFLQSFRDPDLLVARQWAMATAKPTVARSAWEWLKARLAFTAVGGLVAWLVAMPLVAFHFEQLNPWVVPAELLLAPVVVLALVGGTLKILLTFLWPGLSGAWAAMAVQPVSLMRHLLALLAKLPLADVALPAPPVWMILLYYALLCLPLLLRRWPAPPKLKWCVRGGPLAACVMVVMLPPLGGFVRYEDLSPGRAGAGWTGGSEGLRVTILAVGAGQCAVIEPPGGPADLFDVGSDSLADLQGNCLGPFMRHEGRSEIGSIFLSHGDYDHISGCSDAVSLYHVSSVYASPHLRRHAPESLPCENLLADLDRMNLSPKLIVRGSRVILSDSPAGKGAPAAAAVEVLWPPAESKFDSNNTGVVLRLTYAGRSVLFPADIQEPAERELLKDAARLKSDVLIAPHHGSSETSTAAFVHAVDPSIILSSNDRRLTVKQTTFEKIIGNRKLYRTNRCGAIALTITRDGQMRIDTFLPSREPLAASK